MKFEAVDIPDIDDRGLTFAGPCPLDVLDAPDLLGAPVEIFGMIYEVVGIERRTLSGHGLMQGEPVRLLVRRPTIS